MQSLAPERLNTCRNCFKAFNLVESEPRILPHCGHSICKSCITMLLTRSSRSQIKCPFCQSLHRFKRQEVQSLTGFPKNYEIIEDIRHLQNQIITEPCLIHNQESSIFCFDSACPHKSWACALCFRQFHINCREEYIVSKNDFKHRVTFGTGSLGRESLKEELHSYLENIFINFQGLFKAKIDLLVDDFFLDFTDVQVNNISQISRYRNYLSYDLDSATKKISIRRKGDQKLSQRSAELKDVIGKFFSAEMNLVFEKFINIQNKRLTPGIKLSESKSMSIASSVDSNDHLLAQHPGEQMVVPAHLLNNFDLRSISMDSFHNTNQQTIDQFITEKPTGRYLVLEFLEQEESRTKSFKQIFPNLIFLEIRKHRDQILFQEFDIRTLSTFIIIYISQGTDKRIRIENPGDQLLQNILLDVSSGELKNI
jgi:hypothetical protein